MFLQIIVDKVLEEKMDNEKYWFWLCNIDGVWRGTINKLMDIFSSPKVIYEASYDELVFKLGHTNIKDKLLAEKICKSRNIDEILRKYENMQNKNVEFVSVENEKYPQRFREINEYPYGIYIKGNNLIQEKKIVAIVGARNCTLYGRKIAKDIGFELAANDVIVISGLARGIDSEGLWGCVDAGGIPYAVMGCGVDICYPRENIELYERMTENGAIISDYPLGSQPLSWQFPLRNRLISALADAVLVVEAREKSGSLITVEYALEQGKDIFAVPGRVGDALSNGCNKLIKEGAGIATSAKEILDDIGIYDRKNSKNFTKNNIILEKEIETLYSCVDFFPKNIQQIKEETGKDSVEILRGLVKLQMMNLIEEPSKNYYSRKI